MTTTDSIRVNHTTCAIIPAFNEAIAIADVITRVRQYLDIVIVIDDGSSDHTAEQAASTGATVIRHAGNRGKGTALRTGLRHASDMGMQAALCLDADGQHLPDEIPTFLNNMDKGDIILGCRMFGTRRMPLVRKCTNIFMSWLISNFCGQTIRDTQSGYRLIKRKVWEDIALDSSGYAMESEFLIHACRKGYTVYEVPVTTIYNDAKSDIHPIRDTIRFFGMLAKIR